MQSMLILFNTLRKSLLFRAKIVCNSPVWYTIRLQQHDYTMAITRRTKKTCFSSLGVIICSLQKRHTNFFFFFFSCLFFLRKIRRNKATVKLILLEFEWKLFAVGSKARRVVDLSLLRTKTPNIRKAPWPQQAVLFPAARDRALFTLTHGAGSTHGQRDRDRLIANPNKTT